MSILFDRTLYSELIGSFLLHALRTDKNHAPTLVQKDLEKYKTKINECVYLQNRAFQKIVWPQVFHKKSNASCSFLKLDVLTK